MTGSVHLALVSLGRRYKCGMSSPASPQRPPAHRVLGGLLWSLIPIASLGLLAWIPPLHGWLRLRQRSLLAWTVGLAALMVAWVVMISGPGLAEDLGSIGMFATMGLGTVVALILRPKLFGIERSDAPLPQTTFTSLSAVAQVEHARARRAEARQIVERDPAMARELRIGRPDLPGRTYDDGGLVDLNHAPPETLTQYLELTSAYVDELCRARTELQGLSALGEITAYTNLPAPVVDGLGERAIFLRY